VSRSALAVIPARGGSKGVHRKNIRLLGDRPLIAWTIRAAKESASVGRVIVSTDDPEIAEIARAWGAETPFIRPAELSGDETPGDAPFRHAVDQVPGFDISVLLQPTSPFRNAADIDASVALARPGRSAVSVCEVLKHPAWMFTIGEDGLTPILPAMTGIARRQDLPPVYALNGAIYVMASSDLKAGARLVGPGTQAYVMPLERSIDIDTEGDLSTAAALLEAEANLHAGMPASRLTS